MGKKVQLLKFKKAKPKFQRSQIWNLGFAFLFFWNLNFSF
jgi:hypothetical protein